jgi:transitional endoplasmic reticulum ATPase
MAINMDEKKMLGRDQAEEGLHVPPWAEAIRSSFVSSAAIQFLIHGATDVVPFGSEYVSMREFLYRAFCRGKTVVYYNISEGFRFMSKEHQDTFQGFLTVFLSRNPDYKNAPLVAPHHALAVLEEFLLTHNGAVAVVEYAEKVVPAKEHRFMNFNEKQVLTTLQRWAVDPRLLKKNNAVFMIARTLSEVHDDLYTGTSRLEVVDVPLPGEAERLAFMEYLLKLPESEFPLDRDADGEPSARRSGIRLEQEPEAIAKSTNGLSYVQIANMFRRARQQNERIGPEVVTRWKQRSIEAELGDIVEFVSAPAGLEAVAGMAEQKELLLKIAGAMREGHRRIVPQGIMLLGAPGTGKTFTMGCFAHDCGIPFVRLGNVFSKYVGATEANLEKLFHYLNALSPVFVFIDEFDQSYGRRVTGDGDSGVSRRVFAMFNAYLSDPSRQGRVLFGAASNRPDLVDPSTLRAGRFDLKIPFFLPDEKTRAEILEITYGNLHIDNRVEDFAPAAGTTSGYSGADLREIVLQSHRIAVFDGRRRVMQRDLDGAVADYIPPVKADPDMIRFMELLAVAGTTSRQLLSPEHRKLVDGGGLHAELAGLRLSLAARAMAT